MHINVRDILAESTGSQRDYKITGERPQLERSRLLADLEGEFTISRLESGLRVRGRLETEIELECDRCLNSFGHPVRIRFQQVYADKPGDDELPIERAGTIDLEPTVDQEIILSLPIKILCQPDCSGIAAPASTTIKQTKGNLRGRTQKTH
jgi:uncharacterized protein